MNIKRFLIFVGVALACVCAIACQLITYKLNEELAIQTMRRIGVAQKEYRNNQGKYGDLKELVDARLLDSTLADGKDHGYIFDVKQRDGDYYYVAAKPEVYGSSAYRGTGGISIFVDSTSKVRVIYKEGKDPSPADFPPAQDR